MKQFHGHKHGLKLATYRRIPASKIAQYASYNSPAPRPTPARNATAISSSTSRVPKCQRSFNTNPTLTTPSPSSPSLRSIAFTTSGDACGDLIQAFSFQCDECDHRMHVKCAFLPETVECKAHKYTLDLYYTTSKSNVDGCSFFQCDVCDDAVTEGYWTYYCKDCDFVTDLDCATSAECMEEEEEEEDGGEDGEELPIELQLARARISMDQQRANVEFQMQMARRNAEFMTSLANSWKSF